MPGSGNLAGVAIVDDEAGLIRAYELLFKRRNIPIMFISQTGEEAVEKFRRASPRPKVILIDYRLPMMDGIAAMNEILSIEPDTRVIMISGDFSVQQECLDAGADVFFQKPTGIREITDTVNHLLKS
jgi:two-component system chemotaxis response regulator CheY